MSMGVRHFWQYSPCGFLSVAIVSSVFVPHVPGRSGSERSALGIPDGESASEQAEHR
jgi:hypothetical protein